MEKRVHGLHESSFVATQERVVKTETPLDRVFREAKKTTTDNKGADGVLDDFALIFGITYDDDFTTLLWRSGRDDTVENIRLRLSDKIAHDAVAESGVQQTDTERAEKRRLQKEKMDERIEQMRTAAQNIAGEGNEVTVRHFIEGVATLPDGVAPNFFRKLLSDEKSNTQQVRSK